MAKIIAVTLQKGGCGKTSTADSVANILSSNKNKKVLLVDMDSQANATSLSGSVPEHTMSDVLSGECSVTDAITHCKHYDLIAADDYLSNLERIDIIDMNILKDALTPIIKTYDFIIIDTPPALGNLLKISLQACTHILIPTDPRPFSVQGIYSLIPTIEAVKKTNPDMSVIGIVLVKHHRRAILNRQIHDLLQDISEEAGTSLFNTTIREGIALAEAQAMQTPLIDYAPKSNPCLDYIKLTDEIIERVGE